MQKIQGLTLKCSQCVILTSSVVCSLTIKSCSIHHTMSVVLEYHNSNKNCLRIIDVVFLTEIHVGCTHDILCKLVVDTVTADECEEHFSFLILVYRTGNYFMYANCTIAWLTKLHTFLQTPQNLQKLKCYVIFFLILILKRKESLVSFTP